MTREVREIPPVPRPVRWSAVLWFRWPLALCAFLLGVYGGLWTLMLYFASSGKPLDDVKLDRGSTVTVGSVTAVVSVPETIYLPPAEHAVYTFVDADGHARDGKCFVLPDAVDVGASVDIEYVGVSPEINRIRGGRIGRLPDYVTPAFRLTVIPGLAFLAMWLYSVLRMRRVLIFGDAAVAELTEIRRLPVINPGTLAVSFRFRDRRARITDGRHWVRERSALGQRVLEATTDMVVVHDRRRPRWHRLVVAEYFHPPPPLADPDRAPAGPNG